jgi:ferrous-iron efflux pump FieF
MMSSVPAPAEASENAVLRRWASYASLGLAVVMVILKTAAWLLTGSVALLTSVVDAVVDLLASTATLVGVRYAQRPPDREHRFGHGKAESLAALLQAVFLAGAALALMGEGARRLLSPQPLAELEVGLAIVVVSLVAVSALVAFQTYVLRRTGSHAIAADRAHYTADILVNVAVLAALGVTKLTASTLADPLFGIGISFYMLWSAWKIAKEAAVVLLDQELPDADRQRIKDVVLAHKQARGLHDIRTRNAGDRRFVELHLEVDGHLSVDEAHRIADEVEHAVQCALPDTEVIVHQEPAGIHDERLDDRIRRSA